jgi:hypothetical protein
VVDLVEIGNRSKLERRNAIISTSLLVSSSSRRLAFATPAPLIVDTKATGLGVIAHVISLYSGLLSSSESTSISLNGLDAAKSPAPGYVEKVSGPEGFERATSYAQDRWDPALVASSPPASWYTEMRHPCQSRVCCFALPRMVDVGTLGEKIVTVEELPRIVKSSSCVCIVDMQQCNSQELSTTCQDV